MLDLCNEEGIVCILKKFCEQFPQMKRLLRVVEKAVDSNLLSGKGWTQEKESVEPIFQGLYSIAVSDSGQREALDAVRERLTAWESCSQGKSRIEAIQQHIDSFYSLCAAIYHAFPVMEESFVEGSLNFCDALLTAGIQENPDETIQYKWSHPIALLPIYELILGLCEDPGHGEEESGDIPDGLSNVLYCETLYTKLLNRYSFFQPHKGRLYRFSLENPENKEPRIIGIPQEHIYALHHIQPYRLTEKICYSVRECLVGPCKPEKLYFILVGTIKQDTLEGLTELLQEELRPGGYMRPLDAPLTLRITIYDTQCKRVPEPKTKGNLTVEWETRESVDLKDDVSLRDLVFEQHNVIFFLDPAALYRPKTLEYKRPEHLPVLLKKTGVARCSKLQSFQAIQKSISYLVDFLREQSAAYTMRCYAQNLDLNASLLKKLINLYKNNSAPKHSSAYIYLSHQEIVKLATAQYENISRIENYDGTSLAIVRLSNVSGEDVTKGEKPNLLPVTLWQILKSIRSEISCDLLRYFLYHKTPYLSRIEQEWKLIYAFRRVYIALEINQDILRQDKLKFYCLVDDEGLKECFDETFKTEEMPQFISSLQSFAAHIFNEIWKTVEISANSQSGMTEYAKELHSALSKALYGRSCTLEHILLWHLYENKDLAKKKMILDADVLEPEEREKKLQEIVKLSKIASDQPENKHFFAYLVSNADSGRLGIMDTQTDVELYQYYYPGTREQTNLRQKLLLINESYQKIAETCVYLGYTESILYTNALSQDNKK